MINLWQLRVFLEVAETGSFSAAAGRLHLTQPGVSQQIRALETHLGSPLFVRRGHGVELTASGYDLLDPARRMINLSETTERTLMSRRGEISGRLRLGSAVTSAPYNLASWLLDFRALHPDVTVQVDQTEPGPLLGALRAQELDGGFVLGRMRGRGLVHHKFCEDPVTLIVPLGHPWTSPAELGRAESEFSARQEGKDGTATHARIPRHEDDTWVPAVKPGMLREQPLILEHGIGESHGDARRALTDALEERGVNTRDLRIVLELPGPAAVAAAVADGLGVGLVPTSIARRFIGQVAPVRVDGLALVQHIYLIRDRKALNSPAVSAWWKFVESRIGRHSEDPGSTDGVPAPASDRVEEDAAQASARKASPTPVELAASH